MRLFLMIVVLLMVQYKTFGQERAPFYTDYKSLELMQNGAEQLVESDSYMLVGSGLILIGSYAISSSASNPYNNGAGGYILVGIGGVMQVTSFVLRSRGHKNLSAGLNGIRLTF